MQITEKPPIAEVGQDVIVKIQLSGGHNHTLALKSDTPLLRSLLGSVLGRVQNAANRTLFQIPTEGGRAALCFCSDDLVCVITDPPVYVRPNEDESSNGIALDNNQPNNNN